MGKAAKTAKHGNATKTADIATPNAFALSVAVFVVAVLPYLPVLSYDFLSYDDRLYITGNFEVKQGLSLHGILWAFTTGTAANWHPVTWLSHMLDVTLFGVNARAHHGVNIVLHGSNSALFFLLVRRLSGQAWPAFFAGLLFAVHPLHVESVAWIAERKDMLSAFFWLATLLAYERYSRNRSVGRYILVAVLFALGLMSKPMVVTLPFVLLLLDYWPLGRFETDGKWNAASIRRCVAEKVPLFALTVASSVVTFLVQRAGGAVSDTERVPMAARLLNAVAGYGAYVKNTVLPTGLAVLYPHPGWAVPLGYVALGAAALLGVTALAWRYREQRYLLVGWLWFVGTLVPVIGIVQVGSQAYADRYTYIPHMGLFLAVTLGFAALLGKRPDLVRGARVAGGAVLLLFGGWSFIQTTYWQNDELLFRHAIQVTGPNPTAHNNLGHALARQDRTEEALAEFQAALAIKPNHAGATMGLGNALLDMNRAAEAAEVLARAVELDPTRAAIRANYGNALFRTDRPAEALVQLEEAVKLDPYLVEARNGLAIAYMVQGRRDDAIAQLQEALRIDPTYGSARANLERAMNQTP